MKEELEENFSGAANAGRPLLLEGGLDWKALSLSPKDMDFAETKAGAAREIALAFGIPPLLLGLPGDNTFRNYQEANRAFWRQTVIPLVSRLQKSFHAWTQPSFEPFRFDYNADRIDALAQEREMEWRRIGAASFLTVDEQREAAGYGSLPKGANGAAVVGAAEGAIDAIEPRYYPNQPAVPASCRSCGRWTKRRGDGIEDDEDISDGIGDALALADHCAEEWDWARRHCTELLEMPNPPLGQTGGYTDVEDCARGFVSAACGGNSV